MMIAEAYPAVVAVHFNIYVVARAPSSNSSATSEYVCLNVHILHVVQRELAVS